jgi:hypothetical protein
VYSLAPYVGTGRDADPFRPRGSEQPWRAIDLRPDATRPDGYALLVTPEPVRERGVIDLGPSPDDRWSMRSLASRLGVSLNRSTLRQATAALLIRDSRIDGTRWRPVWPERDGVYRIWLGGLLWAMPTLRGGSSFTETWTGANSINLTADQSWTEIVGTSWQLANNAATIDNVSEGLIIARCNTALATADHGVTLTLVTWTYVSGTFQVGPLIRKANDSVQTFYYHIANRDASNNDHRLRRRSAGTATELGSADATDPAGGTTLTVEASGSSVTAKRGGVTTVGPITDPSPLADEVRTGLFGFSNNAGNDGVVDDFTAADLEAEPPASGSAAVHYVYAGRR